MTVVQPITTATATIVAQTQLFIQMLYSNGWLLLLLPAARHHLSNTRQQSQRAICEPLTAVAERVSDNCLGTQNPALSPAGRASKHDLAADRIGTVQGTVRRTYVVDVFLELLEPI